MRKKRVRYYLTRRSTILVCAGMALFVALFMPLFFLFPGVVESAGDNVWGAFWMSVGVVYALLLFISVPVILFRGSGAVAFFDDKIVVRNTVFSAWHYLSYEDIRNIELFYGYVPAGYRRAMGNTILFYRRNCKNSVIRMEITFSIVSELLKHVEKRIIKVDYCSFVQFNAKHRALVWDCLSKKQKEEIEFHLSKKRCEKS